MSDPARDCLSSTPPQQGIRCMLVISIILSPMPIAIMAILTMCGGCAFHNYQIVQRIQYRCVTENFDHALSAIPSSGPKQHSAIEFIYKRRMIDVINVWTKSSLCQLWNSIATKELSLKGIKLKYSVYPALSRAWVQCQPVKLYYTQSETTNL